jgi:hypothetical protein
MNPEDFRTSDSTSTQHFNLDGGAERAMSLNFAPSVNELLSNVSIPASVPLIPPLSDLTLLYSAPCSPQVNLPLINAEAVQQASFFESFTCAAPTHQETRRCSS